MICVKKRSARYLVDLVIFCQNDSDTTKKTERGSSSYISVVF